MSTQLSQVPKTIEYLKQEITHQTAVSFDGLISISEGRDSGRCEAGCAPGGGTHELSGLHDQLVSWLMDVSGNWKR